MRDTLKIANRVGKHERHSPYWQGRKKRFLLGIGALSLALQLLFLGNMSYLYGSIWGISHRFHSFHVLFIDYDGGLVGQAVAQAYQEMMGSGFPTFVYGNTNQYPSPQDVIHAVQNTDYWGGFIVNGNASDNLAKALQGGQAAEVYDPSAAMAYIFDEVRYATLSDEILLSSFENLGVAVRLAYNKLNGTNALRFLNQNDQAAVQTFLNPFTPKQINLAPTTQGVKIFLNTVSMAMVILMQFFFLLELNGLSQEFKLFSKLPVHITGMLRMGLSLIFDFVAALCMTGYIWAFRESWPVNGNQFVLTWMVLWLLMHIHFLVLDTATAFMPLPIMPFVVLTWIIINITSSISPFEANPGFYRIGYALPTNEAYTILTDIWSRGYVPQLYRSLPILLSWWVVGLALAISSHYYRCHKAWKQDEKLENLRHDLPSFQDAQTISGSELNMSRGDQLMEITRGYRDAYRPSLGPPLALLSRSYSAPAEQEKSDRKWSI